jgi:hypothetical protein
VRQWPYVLGSEKLVWVGGTDRAHLEQGQLTQLGHGPRRRYSLRLSVAGCLQALSAPTHARWRDLDAGSGAESCQGFCSRSAVGKL